MAPERCPTVNQNPPVNRLTNQNNVDINSGIDTQMLNQLIATRVAEALAAAAVTHAASTQEENNLGSNSSQNKTCNYKEFRAVMHENLCGTEGDRVKFASSTLLDGALTWWNVYVRSVTLDTAHATPWSDFKAMFIRKYCPRNEISKSRRKHGPTNGNGMETTTTTTPTTPTTLATSTQTNVQRQQGYLQPDKVLMLASYLTTENVDDTTLMHALLLVTTVERQDIRPKTVELHLVPQTKEDQEAKEDREAMSLVLDVVRKDTTRTSVQTLRNQAVGIKFEATRKTIKTIKGRIKGNLREVTKHQPVLKEDVGHLAEYTAYVLKQ
ncbi:hypothetical protein Tco_1294297 [Tanacetum coccineum]